MTAVRALYRQELAYELAPDGSLIARDLPARIVPAVHEGALYRVIAALVDAPDLVIAHAATRYGPLGPTQRLPIEDQAAFVLAWSEQYRGLVAGIKGLGRWISSGGRTLIPYELAPSAHMLCAMAEADPATMERTLDLLTEDPPGPVSDDERRRLEAAMDQWEQATLAGLGRREPLLREQPTTGAAMVRVAPAAGTGRHLGLAARLLPALLAKADEFGPPSSFIEPGALGRHATAFQPYIRDNYLPTEDVAHWRQAANEMAFWSRLIKGAARATTADLARAQELLTTRLRQVDAWPYPAGELIGTFGRGLWSVWPRLTGRNPPRACDWAGCSTLLPLDAHGNRTYCDEHRRESPRRRAARNRVRKRGTPRQDPR